MKRIKSQVIMLTLIVLLLGLRTGYSQVDRNGVEEKYKLDLLPLYPSDEAWESAKNELVERFSKVEGYKGTITRSASDLYNFFEFYYDLNKEASRLYVYCGLRADLDTRIMKYSSMEKEMDQIFSGFSEKSSFINPEILTMSWTTIEQYIKEEPRLSVYRKDLSDLFRTKEHSLSEPEERIMALSGLASGTSSSVYNTFSNAEMPYPDVVLSSGTMITVNSNGYNLYRASANRTDREIVFKAFWDNYRNFEATYGEMLYGSILSDMFYARARKYSSTLEASLFPNNIPVSVYHSLIDNVNKNLPAFHRYLEIKKRMLNVDTLKYLDLYAPVVKDIELKYSYEEARQLVLRALEPLGKEYVSVVAKAFDERWIDVLPTTGKRSGAYSNGGAYEVHPYILLNYNGLYDDVSTLAHELGHTMHSYFSSKTQPYATAGYTTFNAEVASTFNEVLLFKEIIKGIKDDDVKLSLLMNWLDRYKGTLFRQTQFAEFELKAHQKAESGEPLTGENLSVLYSDLVKKYYGDENGVCYIDDYISMEWAFIPHFYRTFYVYQYSTSFTASISLAEAVLNNEKGALERYITFISSGGSDYPIELLQKAGVDMTTSTPFDKTITAMNDLMNQIEEILDKKEGRQN